VCSPKPAEGARIRMQRAKQDEGGPGRLRDEELLRAATDLGVVRVDTGGDTRSRQG
jgi:hypothetical protein